MTVLNVCVIILILVTFPIVQCSKRCYFCADQQIVCKESKRYIMTCKDAKVDGNTIVDYFKHPNTSTIAGIMDKMAVHIRTNRTHCIILEYSFIKKDDDYYYEGEEPPINTIFFLKTCMAGDDCVLVENLIKNKHPNMKLRDCFSCDKDLCNKADDFEEPFEDVHVRHKSSAHSASEIFFLVIISIFINILYSTS